MTRDDVVALSAGERAFTAWAATSGADGTPLMWTWAEMPEAQRERWARIATAASPSASADRGGLREKVAELIVDMTGAGTLGMTNEASLDAARPIADAILALLPEPPALQQKGEET